VWDWDAATGGQEGRTLGWHLDTIDSVAFGPDGKWLASASKALDREGVTLGVTLKVFDPASGRELKTFTAHAKHVFQVVCSPDGRHLASTHFDGTVRLWDVATGAEPRILKGHTGTIINVAFNADGTRLASMDSSHGRVVLRDVAGGQELVTLKGPANTVLNGGTLTFSLDGYRFAATGTSATTRAGCPVVLWNARPR
jgi:WD40 repeat protein